MEEIELNFILSMFLCWEFGMKKFGQRFHSKENIFDNLTNKYDGNCVLDGNECWNAALLLI